MEKSVQPETKYTNDEDKYIQKTFSDKSLTYFQIEKCFEERFKRRLTYDTLFNRNEFLLVEETNQATNNVAISQRACASDPEADVMLINEEMLDELESTLKQAEKKDTYKPNKKVKLDNENYEKLKRDYDELKKENESLKSENKRIISNAAERLKLLSDRKSKLNLDLKADNLKLNNELNLLRIKLSETENQLKELSSINQSNEINNRLEINLAKSASQLNQSENQIKYLNDELNNLKNENLFLKIEKDKALSYAYHYVKKLKDFENALIKERLSQTSKRNSKDFDASKNDLLGNNLCSSSSQASSSSSSSSSSLASLPSTSSILPFSSGNYYININEFLGRPIIKISDNKNATEADNDSTSSTSRTIELSTEESQFLKKYMIKIENQLKNYLETSIKSYYSQQQD